MNKNKVGGGRDIEATAIGLLESESTKMVLLLKNSVHEVIIRANVIEQIVQSTSNSTS